MLSILTLGLWSLVFIWRRRLWIKARYVKASIEKATHVIIISDHNEQLLHKKHTEFDENGNLRIVIIYRYIKYIYDQGEWIMQRNCLKLLNCELHDMIHGIREDNWDLLTSVFGNIGLTKVLTQLKFKSTR